jgi:hypothetical protein
VTTSRRGLLIRFLLRTALLTAMLAVMAGIFGMHFMTGAHGVHSVHAAAEATATATAAPMHGSPAHHAGQPPASYSTEETATAAGACQCADPGKCPTMSSMDAGCVLSSGNTPMSLPLPGTAPFPASELVDAAAVKPGYSYLPGSPSPCELCISRT